MRTRSFAVAAFASCATCTIASADVEYAYWINTGNFGYRAVHMPDLDQRRSGLSNNGANHCVPTSSMNLFAYAANHGYPFVEPGPANWQSNTFYADATAAILALGQEMNTSGATGTTGSGNWNGLNAWAWESGGGLISTIRRSRNVGYSPTVAKMAQLACQGWIMCFAYGRYNIVGTVGGLPHLERDGGHAVTMNRVNRDSNGYSLRYRDPADDDHLTSQSVFNNKVVYPVAYSGYFGGVEVHTLNAIAYPSSDGKVRLIDSYWGIRPTYGYWFLNSSNVMGSTGGSIRLVDPTPFEGTANLAMPQINVSNFVTLHDLAFHPEMSEALILTQSIFNGEPTRLRRLDLMTGDQTAMPDAPVNLVQISPSREGFIYAYSQGGTLYKLDSEGAVELASSSVPAPSSIWFDHATDKLALLSVGERRIALYDKNLGSIQDLAVPTSIGMAGEGLVRIDPTSGKAWFKTEGASMLYNVTVGGAGPLISTIAPPTLVGGLRGFQFGDQGELYCMGSETTKVLRRGVTGAWFEDVNSPFNNGPGGTRLMMYTSNSNHDPAIHDTPAWRDSPATELLDIGESHPDCDADFDGDDVVNGADLGILLSKWGTPRGIADLNQDGVVDGADLGALLVAWGNCP